MEEQLKQERLEDQHDPQHPSFNQDALQNHLFGLLDQMKLVNMDMVFKLFMRYYNRADTGLKMAIQSRMNFDREEVLEYRLEDAILWFKSNYPEEHDQLSGGLFRVVSGRGAIKTRRYDIYHFFIDETDRKVMSGSGFPLRLVVSQHLDTDLEQQFGQEDLIIFQ